MRYFFTTDWPVRHKDYRSGGSVEKSFEAKLTDKPTEANSRDCSVGFRFFARHTGDYIANRLLIRFNVYVGAKANRGYNHDEDDPAEVESRAPDSGKLLRCLCLAVRLCCDNQKIFITRR